MTRLARLRPVLAIVLAVVIAGCTPTVPASRIGLDPSGSAGAPIGRADAPVVPTGQSRRPAGADRAGAEANRAILARFGGEYDNARVQGYVDRIGARLAAVSEQPGERWSFTVLDTDTVNAFATMGGYVYVTRGLVALAHDEAELAGVVGHEIAHITLGHRDRRDQRTALVGVGTLLGAIGAATLGIDPEIAGGILQTAAGGVLASYSREDEREADRLGIQYLADAGYDPFAQAEFLGSLSRHAQLEAAKAGQRYDPDRTGFFATHPATGSRVAEAEAVARRFDRPGADDRRRDAHLGAIDGMSYGPSAEQGLVAEGRFIHPPLDFAFSVPRGWQVQNRTDAVILSGGARRVIFDGGQAETRDPLAYLTERWAPGIARQGRAGRLTNVARLRIDGQPAARGVLPVQIEGRTFAALLTVIQRGDRVWRFTGLVPQGADGLGATARVAESFRRLSAEDRRLARQRRLRVVPGTGSAESLGSRMAVAARPVDTFRVLNGLERGEPLPARVKLVQ